MIGSQSRYADGNVFKAPGTREVSPQVVVTRNFPDISGNFVGYTWKEGDRIDLFADDIYGSTATWWEILDFNPEVLNPWQIPVGTVLRVIDG